MDLIRLKSIQKTVINYGQDRQKNEEFMDAVTFFKAFKKMIFKAFILKFIINYKKNFYYAQISRRLFLSK